jgi:8-oxo-dGTP pyrophosphatase MutT (NUDIX family)
MTDYNNSSFPPYGEWDLRLKSVSCLNLKPVLTIHKNPWFTLRSRGNYFTTEYNMPQVAVLPIVNDNSILMVRVKRPVINDMTLELPAGGLENEEDPYQAANRELREEAGVIISDLSRYIPMPPVAISSTRVPNLSYVFKINITQDEYNSRMSHDEEI